MISGLPYLTSSTPTPSGVSKIEFPMVTSWLLVRNHTAGTIMRFGFTQAAMTPGNQHQFPLDADEQFQANVRVKDLWVSATLGTPQFTVMAGLTSVLRHNFPVLTSSLTTSLGTGTATAGKVVVYEGVG